MRYWLPGVCLSIGLGLALSAGLIFQDWTRAHWATNPDSVAIATAGQTADLNTVLGWWYGPWIQGTGFYRPLSSTLMWLEVRLWGNDFFPYTLVSWGMHAANSGLLFLLLFSMCPGPRWQRALAGLLGALTFSLGRHPAGLDWTEARVSWGIMPYWPAQTDIGSLGFGLGSLLCLDRHLLTGGRKWLVFAIICGVCGLLFKETALTLLVLAPLLALYRRKPWRKMAVACGLAGAGYMVARALLLPEASNPTWMGSGTFFDFLGWIHRLTWSLLWGGELWELVAILTLLPLVIVLWRKRVSVVYLVLACLLWPLIVGGLMTGNIAIATIPREINILLRLAGTYLGLLLVLKTVRSEPAAIFLVGLFIIAVGQINRIGPHYWYWPVAFWGMLDATAANAAVNELRRWRAKGAALRPEPETPECAAEGVGEQE